MRARNYHRKKHRKTHNQEGWDKFKALCKEVNRRVRAAKAEHYRSVCKNFSHQSKSTWKQLNLALARNKHGAINTIKCDGKALTQTKEIVDSFIQHFSSIKLTSSNLDCQLQPVTTNFRFTKISEEAVLTKLTTLNERKATGPDRISAKLLKMVTPAIFPSLTSLFNVSLSQGCFPTEWKEANVTPVPKCSDWQMVNDYRPVSVIPVIAKVFESFVHHQLYGYLEEHRILKEEQGGF